MAKRRCPTVLKVICVAILFTSSFFCAANASAAESNADWQNDRAQGEKLARHVLAYKLDDETRRLYLQGLAACLSQQGKNKEAAIYEAQGRKFNFLVDDERAAAAEIARKNARKH